MSGFIIKTQDNEIIRFHLYTEQAPVTCEAFLKSLPFTATFYHAKISGEEIWIKEAPQLDIIQENSSVFAEAGEVAIGPLKPTRNKISGFMGIFYGEGKLLDSGNIFAKVEEEDMAALKQIRHSIWQYGGQLLFFDVAI